MVARAMEPGEMSTGGGRPSVLPRPHDLEAAFERCGADQEALRECVLTWRRSARLALDAELLRRLVARGQDTRALCARELCAQLSDISVGELLQTISMGRKDAIIEVVHGALVSRIWCSAGEIVDAVSGRLRGEWAAYRILALDAGELVADFRSVRRSRLIASSTQELMLEAVRRKDECAVLQRRLGGASRVYCSVANAAPTNELSSLESATLRAFTPGAAIDSVLAGNTQPDLETLQAIVTLVERGCLVASDVAPARRAAEPDSPERARRRPWRSLGELHRLWILLAASAALGAAAAGLWPVCIRSAPRIAEQSTSRLSAAPTAPPAALAAPVLVASRPSVAGDAAASPSRAYAVEITVEPAQAAFWLDGALIAAGDLSISLARDGRLHELRIAAPGHAPQTLLFRDVPPPRAIALERVAFATP